MIHDLPKNLVEDSRKLLQQGADYEEFFKKALKKFGVNSPADFKSDEEKKKFFDYVDKNYKGKNEGVSVREYVEQLTEGKKGKYQSKGLKNVAKELAKIEKIEKKNKGQDREVKDIAKFVSKNLETEMYDDMEILSGRTLKQLDKMISKLDTDVRDGVAKAIEKADPDLYDMMFGF
jgi:hypothetical protein